MGGLIYLITNNTNGKIYIGRSVKTASKRFLEHKREAAKGIYETALHRAMRKYGFECFSISVLFQSDAVNSKILDRMEVFFIAKYDSCNPKIGYNMTIGGDGGALVSEEVRKKIGNKIRIAHGKIKQKLSYIKKQQFQENLEYKAQNANQLAKARLSINGHRKWTEEQRCNLSNAMKSSEKYRQSIVKMSQTKKEQCNTPEFKQKCRERQLGKKMSDETKQKISNSLRKQQ